MELKLNAPILKLTIVWGYFIVDKKADQKMKSTFY